MRSIQYYDPYLMRAEGARRATALLAAALVKTRQITEAQGAIALYDELVPAFYDRYNVLPGDRYIDIKR